MRSPTLDSTSPAAIIRAPNMTVQRTPTRSAICPIAIPPTAEPSQASEYASAGTERTPPNSAAIGFNATMVMSGAPKETERMPSADQATSHERRVSIVPAAVARPATLAVLIYGLSSALSHCTYELFRLDRRRIHLDAERSQGVADGVGDSGRRGDGAALADPLHAERVERRRRVLVEDAHCRDVAGGRQRVIHQRAAQQLAVRIIGDRLAQDAAKPLSGAAHDLALDQHRVDDDTTIMRNGVLLDTHTAGAAVDIDNRDVHGVAPGDRLRLPVIGLLEAGIDPWRAFVVPARTGGLGGPGEVHCGAGNSNNAHAAIAQFEICRRAFQQIGSDGEDLVPEPLACMVHRRRQCDRAAARHRAKSDRNRGRVGEGYHDVFRADLPQVGRDLRENRLHALALRAGPGRDIDFSRRVDSDEGAFERPDAGPLDIAADAEPEVAARFPRLALTQAERLDTADRIQRLLQSA